MSFLFLVRRNGLLTAEYAKASSWCELTVKISKEWGLESRNLHFYDVNGVIASLFPMEEYMQGKKDAKIIIPVEAWDVFRPPPYPPHYYINACTKCQNLWTKCSKCGGITKSHPELLKLIA